MSPIRKAAIVITSLTILALAIIFSLVKFSEMSAWQLISETTSPNNKYEVRVLRYISDLDPHAPYGNYVIIRPQSFNGRWSEGHVILAGYCKEEATVHWLSNTSLDIICQTVNEKDIRTSSSKAFNIYVRIITK
jgi:uncharacterized protein DUF5412